MTSERPPTIVADLHVHTTASDGVLEIAEIPAIASQNGLSAVAITDHDRLHPDLESPTTRRDDITLIRGIELRVEADDGKRFDLLGYVARESQELVALCERIQSNRISRAKAMSDRLEDQLGIQLDIDFTHGVGRPHLAQAVSTHPRTDLSERDVFRELIGSGKPCYVSRWVPSIDNGLAILEDACALISVAHPFRYNDIERTLALARRVGAIERWYPYERTLSTNPVASAITQYNLLPTGGSDAHDRHLGKQGVPQEAYDHFASHCGIANRSEP